MDKLEERIQQFWENRTSPSERREILRQLEESGMEWKEFMHQYYSKVLAGEAPHDLDETQKSKVWQQLQDKLLRGSAGAGGDNLANNDAEREGDDAIKAFGHNGRVRWYRWAAAACILSIASLCIYQWSRAPSGQLSTPGQVDAVEEIVKTNTGTGEESLTLPDHSLVLLARGSTIRYMTNFEAHARNIQLEGRALFEVAKDSARPFTVTARGFATTALGTRFVVDATRPLVSIRLLKGKVVVNTTGDSDMTVQKVYLIPGQELKINTETKHFDLSNVTDDSLQHAVRRMNSGRQHHGKTGGENNSTTLSFERASLATVFQRLSKYYKTTILFDKAEVQGLSFTGAFEPSDELDLALKVICNMNQLSFTRDNDRIVITRQP